MGTIWIIYVGGLVILRKMQDNRILQYTMETCKETRFIFNKRGQ